MVGDRLADAWQSEFSGDRIASIRRHLQTLAPALDGRKIAAVSASLSFWSRAYYRGRLVGATSQRAGIPTDTNRRAQLVAALDDQLANWYDLLSGRRELDSFPVTAVVSDLVRKYASSQWSQWQAAALVVGVIIAIMVVVIVVAVILSALSTPATGQPALSGLAGGITALNRLFGGSRRGPPGSRSGYDPGSASESDADSD
jgi:hypothetical protein